MTNHQDAATAYDEQTDAITDLLKVLNDDLRRHGEKFARSRGLDWGCPGDLDHVHDLLQQAHDFLNNQE